jgi:hypothetical protein
VVSRIQTAGNSLLSQLTTYQNQLAQYRQTSTSSQ